GGRAPKPPAVRDGFSGRRSPDRPFDAGRRRLPGASLQGPVRGWRRPLGDEASRDEPGGRLRDHHREEHPSVGQEVGRRLMASQRWNVMRVIIRRELRSTLFGIGIYVAAAIILLVIS